MKKSISIGRICVGALAAALIPYHIGLGRKDGSIELDSLLWSMKKVPGEKRDNYIFELLPLLGKK